jgi:hypothetical protein
VLRRPADLRQLHRALELLRQHRADRIDEKEVAL